MLQRFLRTLMVLSVLCFGAAPSSAQTHKDERVGFQIKPPKKWTQIPMQSEEEWIVAKFVSNKTDFYTAADSGYTYKHVATLRVIAFIDELIEQAEDANFDEDEDDEDEDEEEDAGSSSLRIAKVYHDYEEYLNDDFSGGFFVDKESPREQAGFNVRCMEIRAENSSGSGHRLLHTWIFETEIGKIAVEFEVLEDAYKKKKSLIDKTLKSFKPIPRTEALARTTALGSEIVSRSEVMKLSLSERTERKRALHAQKWERLQTDLVKGWEPYEIDEIKILTRHDVKHAKSVANDINAVMGWLDETFPFIGPDEYVTPPFVRICKDWDEEKQFRENRNLTNEIITHKDLNVGWGSEAVYVQRMTYRIWFDERDSDLYIGLPDWLDLGLEYVVQEARVKGSNLKFSKTQLEMALHDREDPWGLERVVKIGREEYNDLRKESARPFKQRISLVRFFLSGAGSKGKYKELLADYIRNVKDIVDEMDEEDEAASGSESSRPKTEEEEDARLKERKQRFRERERRMLDTAFERTFAKLSDAQFRSLNKAYLKEGK